MQVTRYVYDLSVNLFFEGHITGTKKPAQWRAKNDLCKSVRNTLLCVLRVTGYSNVVLISRCFLGLILGRGKRDDFEKAMAVMKNPARWPGFFACSAY